MSHAMFFPSIYIFFVFEASMYTGRSTRTTAGDALHTTKKRKKNEKKKEEKEKKEKEEKEKERGKGER
jgi:hypothetical protein